MKHSLAALRMTGLGMLTSVVCSAAEPVFRHAGFEQLSRGELGNAGQNLFVSTNGELKLINWFDLDRDGHPEIVINNEHNPNESVDAPSLRVFYGDARGFSAEHTGHVAVEGRGFLEEQAGEINVADLNSTFDVPSYIYWGGPGGFAAARRAELTGFGPASLALGDLNRDGRLDLFLANRDSGLTKDAAALNSYVYWGNPHRSFSSAVLTKVPLLGGYSCTAADFFDEGRGAVAYVDEEGVLLVRFDARRRIVGRVRVELPFQGRPPR